MSTVHEWDVKVLDEAKKEITDAEVCLVPGGLPPAELPYPAIKATHGHAGAGKYTSTAITPADGPWLLVVRKKGKSPFVQTLKLTSKAGLFTATPTKTAAALALKTEKVATSTGAVRRTTFTVTLHPSSEVVFISGTEYFNAGTQFHLFAERRRDILYKTKVLDRGSLVTIFSTDHRKRTTYIKANSGWVPVNERIFGSAAAVKPGKEHAPVAGQDISATDVYLYLDLVGKEDPGRVKEVGWFSHSWKGGAILYNTHDNSTTAKRDPADFDARAKDFNSEQRKGWPKLKDALHASCTWRVWGCSANTHTKNMMLRALEEKKKGTKADMPFTVKSTIHHHGASSVSRTEEEVITLASLLSFLDGPFHDDSYCSAAAAFLDIPCFGSPPGVGSNFIKPADGSPEIMMINPTEYAHVFRYCKAEFSPEFKPTDTTFDRGYIDYREMGKRPRAAVPAFQPQRYKLIVYKDDNIWSLAFANGKTDNNWGSNVKLVVVEKKGFGAAKKDGFLFVVTDKDDDSRSKGYFATPDKKVFEVTRTGTDWVNVGGEI